MSDTKPQEADLRGRVEALQAQRAALQVQANPAVVPAPVPSPYPGRGPGTAVPPGAALAGSQMGSWLPAGPAPPPGHARSPRAARENSTRRSTATDVADINHPGCRWLRAGTGAKVRRATRSGGRLFLDTYLTALLPSPVAKGTLRA